MNRSGSDRLSAYATAAVAVTSGAIASTAAAGVVVVDLASSVTGNPGSPAFLNLGAAVSGVPDSHFQAKAFVYGVGGGSLYFAAGSAAGNSSEFVTSRLFGYNDSVAPSAWFVSGGGVSGILQTGDVGYFGFRLPSGGGDYTYGWIEFKNVSGGLVIDRWGYETSVNTAAATPAGGTPAVPGLGGLAALACGAAGVRRSRHRA